MATITNKQLQNATEKDWLSQLKSLDDSFSYSDSTNITQKIPSMDRAEKLVDVITVHGDDAQAYALLELLSGVAQLFTSNFSPADRSEVEMMIEAAIAHAYAQTSHFRNSRDQCLVNSVRCAEWRELTLMPTPTQRPKGKGK